MQHLAAAQLEVLAEADGLQRERARAAATDSTTAGSPTCSASALTAGAADASLTGAPPGRLLEAGTPLMIGSVMTAPLPG